MAKCYLGMDNGTTGTLGVVYNDFIKFQKNPVRSVQHYTQKAQKRTRLDIVAFQELLDEIHNMVGNDPIYAVLERPMTGKGSTAVISGMRFFEACCIMLEINGIGYEVIDSKKWQKMFLPDVKGSKELKNASRDRAIQMHPEFEELIKKHGDADGLLIAKYAQRSNL